MCEFISGRGMALCMVVMFGRIGSVAGGNVIGALLEGNCDYVFGILAVLMFICIGMGYYIMTKVGRMKSD